MNSEQVRYLFSWDEIPGNENERLIEFLKKNFFVDWVKTATIEKIDDGKTIKVSIEKNSLSLRLNDEKTKVTLKIEDGKTDEFIAKTENGKLNIYQVTTAGKSTCEPNSLMEWLRVLITKKQKKAKKIFEPGSTKETLRGWRLHAHKGRDRHDEAARHYDWYHTWVGGVSIIFSALIGSSIFISLEKQVNFYLGIGLGILGILSAALVSWQTFYNFAGRAEQHRITGVKYKIIIRELEQELAKQGEKYFFSWDDIKGKDNGRLKEFLKKRFGIDWVETAKVEKTDDRTIRVFTEKNFLLLRLNDEKTKVSLEIDDGRTDKFIARTENGKLNIYDENINAKWLEDIRKRLDELEIEAPVVPESIYKRIEDNYDGVCFVKKVEELPSQQCPDRL